MASEVLFLTRTFPPAVGGMQAYSYNLHERFRRHHRVHLIALSRSPEHLAWFAPYALARGLVTVLRRPVTHIYVGDAVMAPIGLVLGLARREARTVLTVHGLDLTYPQAIYQAMIRVCARRFDRVVSNSGATAEVAREKGVDPARIEVIPCGVTPPEHMTSRDVARRELAAILGRDLADRRVLTTVGRLVRRKGVAWFVEHVVPRLPEHALYVVVGDGPDEELVRAAASAHPDRVVLLGRVTDAVRDLVLDAADAMVMPNVRVAGDMEGFGIVALEAGVRGLPVVASRTEGIVDAVVDGVTGALVEPEEPHAFVEGIERACALSRAAIPAAVLSRCDWDVVYERYAAFVGLDE